MSHVTVVGGGVAGLVAAVACAEGGAGVTLHEAHRTLGGRARSTAPPYVANEGTHAFYSDGPAWAWLAQRKLVTPAARLSARELAGLRVRRDGALRRGLPAGLVGLLAQRWRTAPVDRDFTTWASGIGGPETARRAANLMGVVTFDADPGRLSAAFVWERLLRVTTPRYPAVRYVLGGWGTVVDRLAARARRLGVEIETGSRVDALPAVGPVVVATELEAARRLLGDATLDGESGRCALLDVGIERREEDAFVVSDLDEAGFAERYSGPDPSLAPPGHELVQAQMPLRAGESKAEGLVRLERVLDLGLPGWRERTTWRREAVAAARTGALDLPGSTWRDRPAMERGDGVYLAGDRVAAPGLLSEVSLASALRAASGALAELGAPAARSRR